MTYYNQLQGVDERILCKDFDLSVDIEEASGSLTYHSVSHVQDVSEKKTSTRWKLKIQLWKNNETEIYAKKIDTFFLKGCTFYKIFCHS